MPSFHLHYFSKLFSLFESTMSTKILILNSSSYVWVLLLLDTIPCKNAQVLLLYFQHAWCVWFCLSACTETAVLWLSFHCWLFGDVHHPCWIEQLTEPITEPIISVTLHSFALLAQFGCEREECTQPSLPAGVTVAGNGSRVSAWILHSNVDHVIRTFHVERVRLPFYRCMFNLHK